MKSRKPTGQSSQTSRRRFTKSVAATIVAAPLVAGMARALDQGETKEANATPGTQPAEPAQKPPSLVEAYVEVARARFGERLSPEQLEQVKKDLEDNLRASERLRTVKLRNEDEPDAIFSVE